MKRAQSVPVNGSREAAVLEASTGPVPFGDVKFKDGALRKEALPNESRARSVGFNADSEVLKAVRIMLEPVPGQLEKTKALESLRQTLLPNSEEARKVVLEQSATPEGREALQQQIATLNRLIREHDGLGRSRETLRSFGQMLSRITGQGGTDTAHPLVQGILDAVGAGGAAASSGALHPNISPSSVSPSVTDGRGQQDSSLIQPIAYQAAVVTGPEMKRAQSVPVNGSREAAVLEASTGPVPFGDVKFKDGALRKEALPNESRARSVGFNADSEVLKAVRIMLEPVPGQLEKTKALESLRQTLLPNSEEARKVVLEQSATPEGREALQQQIATLNRLIREHDGLGRSRETLRSFGQMLSRITGQGGTDTAHPLVQGILEAVSADHVSSVRGKPRMVEYNDALTSGPEVKRTVILTQDGIHYQGRQK